MLLAVALGAFGAHALAEMLQNSGRTDTWNTAVLYQSLHGLALLATGLWQRLEPSAGACAWLRWAGLTWTAGIIAFSGSLYGYSLGGPRWLVFVTPLGGIAFLLGWIALLLAAWRLGREPCRPV